MGTAINTTGEDQIEKAALNLEYPRINIKALLGLFIP